MLRRLGPHFGRSGGLICAGPSPGVGVGAASADRGKIFAFLSGRGIGYVGLKLSAPGGMGTRYPGRCLGAPASCARACPCVWVRVMRRQENRPLFA